MTLRDGSIPTTGSGRSTVSAIVLASRPHLDTESFARRAGLHPELVRRLVCLGLLEPVSDGSGRWWFPTAQVAAAARLQRLRAGFALNYAGLGLVVDLLDRIAALEAALQRRSPTAGGEP